MIEQEILNVDTTTSVASGAQLYIKNGGDSFNLASIGAVLNGTEGVSVGNFARNTFTLSPGNFEIVCDISRAGSTPVGIVGFNLNDRGLANKIFFTGMFVLNKTQAVMYGQTTANMTITPRLYVLFIKD